jgi:hypothetical protein
MKPVKVAWSDKVHLKSPSDFQNISMQIWISISLVIHFVGLPVRIFWPPKIQALCSLQSEGLLD